MAGVWSQGFTAVSPGTGRTVPIENKAPPSTYAVASVLEGEQGAWLKVVGVTALRAAFIFPGVWLSSKIFAKELTGPQQLGIVGFVSTTITVGMLGYYAIKRGLSGGVQDTANAETGTQGAEIWA